MPSPVNWQFDPNDPGVMATMAQRLNDAFGLEHATASAAWQNPSEPLIANWKAVIEQSDALHAAVRNAISASAPNAAAQAVNRTMLAHALMRESSFTQAPSSKSSYTAEATRSSFSGTPSKSSYTGTPGKTSYNQPAASSSYGGNAMAPQPPNGWFPPNVQSWVGTNIPLPIASLGNAFAAAR
ncbi:MAG: hypothetical protein ABI306_04495, partial [Caulobacteraceae bacterium]